MGTFKPQKNLPAPSWYIKDLEMTLARLPKKELKKLKKLAKKLSKKLEKRDKK